MGGTTCRGALGRAAALTAAIVASPDGGRAQGAVIPAGQDLQAAIDAAQPGDVITIAPGTTLNGPFRLRDKPGTGWITIRSSEADRLPAGVRVTPADAGRMPTLQAAEGSVIETDPGAHHYRFVGLEIRPAPGVFLFNLVRLGNGESSVEQLPHDIVFERCYVHGDPERGSRRGIAMNGAAMEVVDSYFEDFKERGADSQAIAGWAGPGPFRIENNHLEAAGENVLFGGADPEIRGLVPSDIVVRGNHMKKPLTWKQGEEEYDGSRWTIKNLFELKNARRVRVESNLFEQNWVQSQSGFAIVFTVRNQDGGAPWSVVEDVTFAHNVVRRTGSGVNVLGQDDLAPSQKARRIVIFGNLFEDVGDERWGGGGRLFQILDATEDVVIAHNTAFQTGNLITADGRPHAGFVFRDNIAPHNEFGINGAALFPGGVFRRNAIVGGSPAPYLADNFFPPSLEAVGFVNHRAGDYRLREGSPFRNAATDGSDVGADVNALAAALAAATPSAVPRRR